MFDDVYTSGFQFEATKPVEFGPVYKLAVLAAEKPNAANGVFVPSTRSI